MDLPNFRNFVFMCILLRSASTIELEFLLNNRTFNSMNFVIPTLNSENGLCKNHSLLYLEELSKFTVWAIDMFDSTTKFPSGIFFGAIYDTGNFDECISVRLPPSIGFSGRHCMAHYKIIFSEPMPTIMSYELEFEDIYNLTLWDKIAMFAKDPRRKNRDEMYISYCIPSSCSPSDLEFALKRNVDLLNENLPFDLDVHVDQRNCQIETELKFTNGDKIFMGIVGVFISIGVLCTAYHLILKLEGAKHLKPSEKVHDIIKAFSYSHTIKKLMGTSHNSNNLQCLDGLKVLSTFFVVLGHRLMFTLGSTVGNPTYVEKVYDNILYAGPLLGPIVVDTFFTISGFLACHYIINETDRRQKGINPIQIYIHRLLRLTPAYVAILGFYMTIFVRLGTGPFWLERIEVEQERCIESWWTNLLYINNYVKVDQICMFQSWFITCDMQYFLFVPFLAYILWKKPKTGIICCSILIFVSLLVHFMVLYINEEDPFILLYLRLIRDPVTDPTYLRIHIPAHMRATPYFIGVMAAYVKFKLRNSELKISSWFKHLFWLTVVAIVIAINMIGMLYYKPVENKNYILSGLYGSIHHFLWSIAIAWCIIAVSEGHSKLLAPFLNIRLWTILSKITFTSFLCHGAVQLYSTGTIRYPAHLGLFNFTRLTVSDIVLSYFAGFCLSLVFESPLMELEKIAARTYEREKSTNVNSGVSDGTISASDFKKNDKERYIEIYKPQKVTNEDKSS